MTKSVNGFKVLAVSLGICVLCAGLVLFGTGCPTSTSGCTTNAQCDDGLYCNGAETCANGTCAAGTSPCAQGVTCDETANTCAAAGCGSDADCAEGEFCDTQTGECVVNVNLYETVEFDHGFHQGVSDCGTCHHDGAGFSTCDTCHDRDAVVGGIPVLQDAMHNVDTGCWACHDDTTVDGLRDCRVCHTALGD
ncbi:MAG: hypothetical protein V1790_17970 [Planctomycetota bacterium]